MLGGRLRRKEVDEEMNNIDQCVLKKVDYNNRIFQAMNYISGSLDRDVSLLEIANSASFSSYHFHRIFKAVVGENVAEFTRRLRLELACNHLLSYPQKDITSIAFSCGFSSSQNFAKLFKLKYNITPTEFRKQNIPIKSKSIESNGLYPHSKRKKLLKDVIVKELPEMTVASIRCIGMYPEVCMNGFKKLFSWASNNLKVMPGKVLSMYWDNPDITTIDKCRFDCCLEIPNIIQPSDSVFIQKLEGGVFALCRFEVEAYEIKTAWEESFQWLVESGLECRPHPCYEIYHNNAQEHPDKKWVFDIAVPLIKS